MKPRAHASPAHADQGHVDRRHALQRHANRGHVLEHFAGLETQMHAARLGMWIFLASEVLLFGALFALYATSRAAHPTAFHAGVRSNTKLLGSLNTGVLLTSSTLVAASVPLLRLGRRKVSGILITGTIALALLFLFIKFTEYRRHFHEGIYPGGAGSFFAIHDERGTSTFWTLYYAMTGLHAVHVSIGALVLGVLLAQLVRGTLDDAAAHRLEIGALYWHLVDVLWIFLWPLFYLA